jgi:hypothetical protein
MMSVHFTGLYQLQGPTRRVEKRIKELERNSQKSYDVPPVSFAELNTKDIYSEKTAAAHCKATVLTSNTSRDFCQSLGLEFPTFTDIDRRNLAKIFSPIRRVMPKAGRFGKIHRSCSCFH